MKAKTLIIALLIVLLIGCSKKTDIINVDADTPTKTDIETPPSVPNITTPDKLETQIENLQMIDKVSCDLKGITLTFTNTLEREISLDNVDFYINAAIDKTPECDKTTLKSGESTKCTGLDFVFLKYKENVVHARIGQYTDGNIVTLECPSKA